MFITYLQTGLVKDWIPPRPIYAKNSPDYKNYIEGKLGRVNDWDDDKLTEVMDELIENLELTDEEFESIKARARVVVDPVLINNMELVGDNSLIYRNSNNGNTFDGVSTNNLEEMQKILHSWMTGEPESKYNNSNDNQTKMFGMTADALIEAYYTTPAVHAGGLANAMRNGIDDDEQLDPNEMIIDKVSGRPMTRTELSRREFIRFLSSGSDWNELRLMKHLGVGSNFELKLLEQKRRSKRKNKKKAQSFMYDIVGDDIDLISSIDQLNDALFDD